MKTMTCKECKGLEHLNCSACGNTGVAPSVAGMDGWRESLEDAARMLEAHSPGGGSVESYAAQDIRAMLSAAPVPPVQGEPVGEVVVTRDEAGQIIAVTRQDQDGRILSVIAESAPQSPAQVDEREALRELLEMLIESDIRKIRYAGDWRKEVHNRAVALRDSLPAPSADGGKVESAGYLHALQVDALNHIIRTCQGSRTSTRRLRWIEQRAKYALDGKPYSDDAFDLPKDATGSNEKLRDEVRRLREALERAREYIGNQPVKTSPMRKGNQITGYKLDAGANDAMCILSRIDAALSAQQGEGERG